MKTDGRSPSALGFLTIVEREPHGLFGGLLLLNLAGRPLEFHCTAPLKPNRAQQILYGPTLKPFLYGEHIGRALAQKCAIRPFAVFLHQPEALSLRAVIDTPVCVVERARHSEPSAEKAQSTWRVDAGQALGAPHFRVTFNAHSLLFDARWRSDAEQLQTNLAEVSPDFDLLEPFDRIEAAIDEAQRATR